MASQVRKSVNGGAGQSASGQAKVALAGSANGFDADPAVALQAALGPWAQMNGQGLETSMHAGMTLINNSVRISNEVMSFVSRRLSEDMALPGQLVASQTPAEFAQIWTGFLAARSTHYTDEINRLGALMSDVPQADSVIG